MDTKLELEIVKDVTPKSYRRFVDQDLVDKLNKIVEDPEYGEQFQEEFVTHLNVLQHSANWSMTKYVKAIKFFALVQQEHTLKDAYCKVFPERLKARYLRGQSKDDIGGEASRYNGSPLLNKIREQALVPFHLVNQCTRQKAVNVLANLMAGAKSEMVQQKSAEALIRELRPPENMKLEVEVGVKENGAIEALRKATEQYALQQLQNIKAGQAVKEIAESVIEVKVEDSE